MNYDGRITLIFFAVSVAIHGTFFAVPHALLWKAKELPPKELIVEIEKPKILPKIEKIAEEKKLKKSEPKKEEAEIKETVADIEPKKEEVVEEDTHDEAMFRYKDAIKQKIESHRRYPRSARKHKLEGNSMVEFIVMSNGGAYSDNLLHSSGYAVLDDEALAMVKRASPFPPIPAEFKLSEFRMEVTIIFDLQ